MEKERRKLGKFCWLQYSWVIQWEKKKILEVPPLLHLSTGIIVNQPMTNSW